MEGLRFFYLSIRMRLCRYEDGIIQRNTQGDHLAIRNPGRDKADELSERSIRHWEPGPLIEWRYRTEIGRKRQSWFVPFEA